MRHMTRWSVPVCWPPSSSREWMRERERERLTHTCASLSLNLLRICHVYSYFITIPPPKIMSHRTRWSALFCWPPSSSRECACERDERLTQTCISSDEFTLKKINAVILVIFYVFALLYVLHQQSTLLFAAERHRAYRDLKMNWNLAVLLLLWENDVNSKIEI